MPDHIACTRWGTPVPLDAVQTLGIGAYAGAPCLPPTTPTAMGQLCQACTASFFREWFATCAT
jgi:hypothetical protein